MRFFGVLGVLLVTGCASQLPEQTQPANADVTQAEKRVDNAKMHELDQLLIAGYKELEKGNAVGATKKYLIPLTEACDELYKDKSEKFYAARSQGETLFYLLSAAKENKNARVISSTCADGYFYMGYASLDLGRIEKAQFYVEKAVAMSPVNASYLVELGHIHQTLRDWQNALTIYMQAEQYAQEFSPEQVKNKELSRAKRGVGYSLIELGELDKAKEKYQQCLELDPNDKKALNELQYIESLQNKNI